MKRILPPLLVFVLVAAALEVAADILKEPYLLPRP